MHVNKEQMEEATKMLGRFPSRLLQEAAEALDHYQTQTGSRVFYVPGVGMAVASTKEEAEAVQDFIGLDWGLPPPIIGMDHAGAWVLRKLNVQFEGMPTFDVARLLEVDGRTAACMRFLKMVTGSLLAVEKAKVLARDPKLVGELWQSWIDFMLEEEAKAFLSEQATKME